MGFFERLGPGIDPEDAALALEDRVVAGAALALSGFGSVHSRVCTEAAAWVAEVPAWPMSQGAHSIATPTTHAAPTVGTRRARSTRDTSRARAETRTQRAILTRVSPSTGSGLTP